MKKKKLLAIVDDWERLERYEDLLHGLFEFHGAPFGSHGIEIAIAEKPDFVLIDLEFEDMNAEEVLDLIRAHDLLQNTFAITIGVPEARAGEKTHVISRPASVDHVFQFLKNHSA